MKKIILLIYVILYAHSADAQNDKWSFVSMMPPSADSTRQLAAGFSINGVGYVGLGMNPGGSIYKSLYKVTYSPFFNLDVWAPIADFPFETYDVISFGIGNKGYVLTSMNASHAPSNILYEYDTLNNAWTMVSTFPGAVQQGASSFVLNDKAYIISGWKVTAGTGSNEVWEYDPATNQWAQKNNFPGLARTRAVAFSIDSIGYFGTGHDALAQKQKDFWKYDAVNDSWTQLSDVPFGSRAEAVGMSIDGRGYISTGVSSSYLNDLWEYYPSLDRWIEKEMFPGFSRTNCMSYSIGSRGYVGLGFGGTQNSIWAFTPGNLATGNVGSYYQCMGDTLSIEYISYNQTFSSGNIFNVELADAGLSFSNPIVIGTLTSTADHGFITAVIPQGLTPSQNYRIRVTSSSPSLVSGMNSYYFSIAAIPPQPTITTNGDTLISSAATGNQWYDVNGPISGAIDQQFVASTPGNYYVVVNNGGCGSFPSSIVSGIKELSTKNSIVIFPNPSNSIFIIQSKNKSAFTVTNNIGEILVASVADKGLQIPIDLSAYPPGVYYLNVIDERTSEIKTEKLILIK